MDKIKVVLDCRVGNGVAGDIVDIDEKLALELISIGRASIYKADSKDEPKVTSVPKKKTKQPVQN